MDYSKQRPVCPQWLMRGARHNPRDEDSVDQNERGPCWDNYPEACYCDGRHADVRNHGTDRDWSHGKNGERNQIGIGRPSNFQPVVPDHRTPARMRSGMRSHSSR